MAAGRRFPALCVALSLGVAIAGACGPSALTVRERFEASAVEVDIHLEKTDAGTTIVATFRLLRDGLRLYGQDLPIDGIAGTGRPTRVDVVDPGWRAVGPAQPSVVAEEVTVAGFDEPFPTYPDGPVTLRQAIESTGDLDDGRVDLAVTFMACASGNVCFPAVDHHAMSLPSG